MFRWGGQASKPAAPAAPEGDFKVTIQKTGDSHMLGVTVEETEDNTFLVKGFRDWGLIAKLNKTHHKETPPEQRVDIRDQDDYEYYFDDNVGVVRSFRSGLVNTGDSILAVNGVFGDLEAMKEQLGKKSKAGSTVVLTMKRAAAENPAPQVKTEAVPEPVTMGGVSLQD